MILGFSHSLASCWAALHQPHWRTLFLKALSDFRRNMAVSHLVNCFNTYDPAAEAYALKTLFELALCLTRPNTRISSASRISEITSSW